MSNLLDADTGLDVPSMSEIESDFVTEIQDNIEPSFALKNSNMLSQVVIVSSQQLTNQWETVQQGISVINPNFAQGNNLVDSAQWVGVNKVLAQPTKVYLMLTSETDGTIYPDSTSISILSPAAYTVINRVSVTIQSSSCNQVVINVIGDTIDEGTLFSFELDGSPISYTTGPGDTASVVALALYDEIVSTETSFSPALNDTTITVNAATAAELDYSVSFSATIITPVVSDVGLEFSSISALLPFYNNVTGDISIPAGSFGALEDQISANFTGVTCFQPNDGINGNDTETDQQLRVRRQQSLATGGNRTIDAVRSALNETDYVQKSQVYQNRLSVDKTLPGPTGDIILIPNSLYAVVLGGYKLDIATSIFDSMSEGIQTNGAVPVYVVDDNGNNDLINFDYADELIVYLNVTVNIAKNVFYQVSGDVISTIQTSILEYFDSLEIGDTMYVNSIASLAGCQVQYGVKSVSVSYKILPDGSLQTTDLEVNANQVVATNVGYLNIVLQVS